MPVCKYDPDCYRKSADHLKKYSHPKRDAAKPTSRAASVTRGGGRGPSASPPPKPIAHRKPSKSPTKPTAAEITAMCGRGSLPGGSKRPRSPSTDHLRATSSNAPFTIDAPSALPLPLTGTLEDCFGMPYPGSDVAVVAKACIAADSSNPAKAFHGADGPTGKGSLVFSDWIFLEHKPTLCKFDSDRVKWLSGRHRFDPPEVQTAVSGEGFRLSYFRDDPAMPPRFVVKGNDKEPTFEIVAETLCEALVLLFPATFATVLTAGCTTTSSDELEKKRRKLVTTRKKEQIAMTFDGLGMHCPYNKKTELGYRPMMTDPKDMRTILQKLNNGEALGKRLDGLWTEEMQFSDIANDECDFGLGVELGRNLLFYTRKRNVVAAQCLRILDMAYMLLGRHIFQHILALHLEHVLPPDPRSLKKKGGESTTASPKKATSVRGGTTSKPSALLVEKDDASPNSTPEWTPTSSPKKKVRSGSKSVDVVVLD